MRSVEAFQSASGNPVYQRFNSPIFIKDLQERFRDGTILKEITSESAIPTEVKRYGQEVIWEREPDGEFHTYQENQELVHSDLQTETYSLVVNQGVYWSLKLDAVTVRRTEDINRYVEAFKKNSVYRIERHALRQVFVEMIYNASPHNKGTCAGRISGETNLGVMGAPIKITPKNIFTYVQLLKKVLQEHESRDSQMYVLFPDEAQVVMSHRDSFLASAYASGLKESIILTSGSKIPDIAGYRMMFSADVPRFRDPSTNRTTYAVIAARKEALAFISDMVVNRTIDSDPRSFGKYWQGLQVYGYKLMQEEDVAILYCYFEFELD